MSYAKRGADCIYIVRQCVGEYVPGRAGTRSNCQRALSQAEKLLAEADAEIAALKEEVERLREVLRERDGGAHDDDCKHHYRPGSCTCGHLEAASILRDGEGGE